MSLEIHRAIYFSSCEQTSQRILTVKGREHVAVIKYAIDYIYSVVVFFRINFRFVIGQTSMGGFVVFTLLLSSSLSWE